MQERYDDMQSILQDIAGINDDIYFNKAKINFSEERMIRMTKSLPLPIFNNRAKEEMIIAKNYFAHIKSSMIDEMKYDLGLGVELRDSWRVEERYQDSSYQIQIHHLILQHNEEISKEDYIYYCQDIMERKEILELNGYELNLAGCSTEETSLRHIEL